MNNTTATIYSPKLDDYIDVEVKFIYNPAEPMSRDMEYGGCDESIDVCEVKLDGVEFKPTIEQSIDIEAACWACIEEINKDNI